MFERAAIQQPMLKPERFPAQGNRPPITGTRLHRAAPHPLGVLASLGLACAGAGLGDILLRLVVEQVLLSLLEARGVRWCVHKMRLRRRPPAIVRVRLRLKELKRARRREQAGPSQHRAVAAEANTLPMPQTNFGRHFERVCWKKAEEAATQQCGLTREQALPVRFVRRPPAKHDLEGGGVAGRDPSKSSGELIDALKGAAWISRRK